MNTKHKLAKQKRIINDEEHRYELTTRLERFEFIFNNIPEAVIFTDPNGHVIQINQSAESYLGEWADKITPEEWPQKFGFYLADTRRHYPSQNMPLVRALQGETVQAKEMVLRRNAESSGIWVSMSATPINDENGRIRGAVVSFRDITRRIQAEMAERLSVKHALNVSEERFRSIFVSTTLGIKVLDLEGRILETNPAHQFMVGYTDVELVGQYFYSFLHRDDAPRALRLFHDLQISGAPDFRLEHRILNKEGAIIWVKTTFTAVKKGGGDDSLIFVVGIIENITEQKKIEIEMAEMKNRVQHNVELERLHLARELHDGPMQELYSAMYRIKGFRGQADPQLEESLESVNNDIQRILQELRSIAKELRPPTIGSFGLEKAIRSHADDFQEKFPEMTIHLALAQDRQLLPEGIRLALFRIYQQSLANVVRHAEATEMHVRFTVDAEEARLEISDNGKGFDAPHDWIELARRGHFGLAGAAERVNALGGVFTVESRPQNGTRIRAVIPFMESSE